MTTSNDLFTQLAKEHFGIRTLETRSSDSLDFHEVAVWDVLRALTEAYECGGADSLDNGSLESEQDETRELRIAGKVLGLVKANATIKSETSRQGNAAILCRELGSSVDQLGIAFQALAGWGMESVEENARSIQEQRTEIIEVLTHTAQVFGLVATHYYDSGV